MGAKNSYGSEGERLHDRESISVRMNGFITADRLFQIAVSVVTVLVAVAGATLSFSEKANSVVHSIRESIYAQNTEIARLVAEQKKLREEIDEHKYETKESTEVRARYHHTATQLNCALCKGISVSHDGKKATEYR